MPHVWGEVSSPDSPVEEASLTPPPPPMQEMYRARMQAYRDSVHLFVAAYKEGVEEAKTAPAPWDAILKTRGEQEEGEGGGEGKEGGGGRRLGQEAGEGERRPRL